MCCIEKGSLTYTDNQDELISHEISLENDYEFDRKKCEAFVKVGISFPEYINPVVKSECYELEKRCVIFELNPPCVRLSELISKRKLNASEILQIIKNLNQILYTLHVHGLYHMNIRMSNILLIKETPISFLLSNPRLVFSEAEEKLPATMKTRIDYLQMGVLLLGLLGIEIRYPDDPLALLEWAKSQTFPILEIAYGSLSALIAGILDTKHENAWGYPQVKNWIEETKEYSDKLIVPFFVDGTAYDSLPQIAEALRRGVIPWETGIKSIFTEEFRRRVMLSCHPRERNKYLKALYTDCENESERLDRFLLLFGNGDSFCPYGVQVTLPYLLQLVENKLKKISIDDRGKLLLQLIQKGSLSKKALVHSTEKNQSFDIVHCLRILEILYHPGSEEPSYLKMKKALEILLNPSKWMIPKSIERESLNRLLMDYAPDLLLFPSEEDYARFLSNFLVPFPYNSIDKVRSLSLEKYGAFLAFYREYQKEPFRIQEFEEICVNYYLPQCIIDIPKQIPDAFLEVQNKTREISNRKEFFTKRQFQTSEYRSMVPEVFSELSIDEYEKMAKIISLGITKRFLRKCKRIQRRIRIAVKQRDPIAVQMDHWLYLTLSDSHFRSKLNIELIKESTRLFTIFPPPQTIRYFFSTWLRKCMIWVSLLSIVLGGVCAAIVTGSDYWLYSFVSGLLVELTVIFLRYKVYPFWPAWVYWLGPLGGLPIAMLIVSVQHFATYKLAFLAVFGFGSFSTFVYAALKTRNQGFRLLFSETRHRLSNIFSKIRL
ncbi:MAG TPA: hypothetical protein PLP59_08685 [Thermotogota bacterium]|nr:hypothetical protein [Thermotogota bacterium]HPB87582.1 hypothetical protein [Thermotogota bacterium]HPH11197.1 hypothetical protein [Thermotogota bacterium]